MKHIILLLVIGFFFVPRVSSSVDAGWVTLFDGKTFTGWDHAGNWVIEDGAFYRKAKGGKLWLQDHGADVWFRNLRWRVIPQTGQLARSAFTPIQVPPEALKKENARVEKMLEARKK